MSHATTATGSDSDALHTGGGAPVELEPPVPADRSPVVAPALVVGSVVVPAESVPALASPVDPLAPLAPLVGSDDDELVPLALAPFASSYAGLPIRHPHRINGSVTARPRIHPSDGHHNTATRRPLAIPRRGRVAPAAITGLRHPPHAGIVPTMEPGDLGLLVTLDALLQECSVTRAAKRLGLSTPAMSHALARIRDKLGDPLLVRAGRGMVLTPRAAELRPRVREVVAGAEQALAPKQPFAPQSLARAFRILATDHVLLVLGLEVDRILRAEAPAVDLRFAPNSPDDPEALRQGAADLAVGIYGELPPEMRTRPLLTDRHVCLVRDGHPEVGARLTLAQYTGLPHVQIAPRGAPGGYVDDTLRGLGHTRRVARAVPFFVAGLHLVAETDYLLTAPERVARAMAPRFGLRILEPPLELRPYTLSLLWHPRFDADEGHRWLRDALVRAARARASDTHRGARTRLDPGARRRKP